MEAAEAAVAREASTAASEAPTEEEDFAVARAAVALSSAELASLSLATLERAMVQLQAEIASGEASEAKTFALRRHLLRFRAQHKRLETEEAEVRVKGDGWGWR